MIKERCLPAGFVAGDLLRLERHEIEDVLRRLRRRLCGLSAWIEAAAFESFRIAQVEVVVCVRLELDRCAGRERLVDAPAAELGCGRDWNADVERGRAAEQRLTTKDVGLPKDLRLTFVIGVAAPERHAPLRSEVVRQVAED